MIFLIEYNRTNGKIVTFKQFTETQRELANRSRLNLEIDLNRRGITHEVALLEASSEAALRRTHRRYFENLSSLVVPSSV